MTQCRAAGLPVTLAGLVTLSLAALLGGCGTDSSTSLAALSPADGAEQWRRGDVLVGGAMEATDDAIAVVGYERCSNRGRLTVLETDTGETRWSTPVEGGFGGRSVAITSDLVVSAGSSDVRALEIDDGSERWTRLVNEPRAALVAALDDSIAVAELAQPTGQRTFTSRLAVVDRDDGSPRWEIEFPEEQVIDVAVGDTDVYARLSGMSQERAGHTTVVALDTADGLVRWMRDLGVSEIGTELLVADDTVIVNLKTISWFDGEQDLGPSSAVVALDRTDGVDRWRLDGPVDDGAPPPGSPVEALDVDGSVVVGSDVDGLVAWDAATGTIRWRLAGRPGDAWIVEDQVLWSPLVGGNSRERLDAVDLDDGTPRWSAATDGWTRDVDSAHSLVLAASRNSPSCD